MIPWQDFVFTGGSFLFILALLPILFTKEYPPRSTSLLIGGVLAIFLLPYASLGLWLAFSATAIQSALWFSFASLDARRQRRQAKFSVLGSSLQVAKEEQDVGDESQSWLAGGNLQQDEAQELSAGTPHDHGFSVGHGGEAYLRRDEGAIHPKSAGSEELQVVKSVASHAFGRKLH